jgi:hypothetical protein
MRRVVGLLVVAGLAVGLLGVAVVGSAMAMLGTDVKPAATTAAGSKVPPAMLALYQKAAAMCPGLPWTVLAAQGFQRTFARWGYPQGAEPAQVSSRASWLSTSCRLIVNDDGNAKARPRGPGRT